MKRRKLFSLAMAILLVVTFILPTTAQAIEPDATSNSVVRPGPGGDAVTVIPKKCMTFVNKPNKYVATTLTTILVRNFKLGSQIASGLASIAAADAAQKTSYVCTWQYRRYNDTYNRWQLYQTIVHYKYSNYTSPINTQVQRLGFY